MVKDEKFPLLVIDYTVIIYPDKMETGVIYCCDCKEDKYQIEKLSDGRITVLREWLK